MQVLAYTAVVLKCFSYTQVTTVRKRFMRCRRRRLKHHLLEFRWVTVLSSNSSHCSCITSCVGAVSEKIKSHLTGLWGAAGYFFLKRPYKSDVSAHKWARYTSIIARKPHTEVLTCMKTKMAQTFSAWIDVCVNVVLANDLYCSEHWWIIEFGLWMLKVLLYRRLILRKIRA